VIHVDHEFGAPRHASACMAQASDHFDPPHGAADCFGETRAGCASHIDSKRRVESKSTGADRHLGGLGHQVVLKLHLRPRLRPESCNRKQRTHTKSRCSQRDHLTLRNLITVDRLVTSSWAGLCPEPTVHDRSFPVRVARLLANSEPPANYPLASASSPARRANPVGRRSMHDQGESR
jgi:hypothetical protein